MSRTIRVIDGDWVLDVNGRLSLVDGFEKLGQDSGQSILDEFDPVRAYGTRVATVRDFVNSNEDDIGIEVFSGINRLIDKQQEDVGVTKQELISEIQSVVVDRIGTSVFYHFVVLNSERVVFEETVELSSFGHLLPSDFDGSTAQRD